MSFDWLVPWHLMDARRDAPSASACDRLTGEEGKRLTDPKYLTVCPVVTKIYRESSHNAQYECKRSNLSLQMRESKHSNVFCWSQSQSPLTILGTQGTRKRRPLHLTSRAFFLEPLSRRASDCPTFPKDSTKFSIMILRQDVIRKNKKKN